MGVPWLGPALAAAPTGHGDPEVLRILPSAAGTMTPASHSPLVSIMLVCRNGGPYLGDALASIRGQTEANWELLFFDNGSSDGSGETAAAHAPGGTVGAAG